jgi:hypothetical protein
MTPLGTSIDALKESSFGTLYKALFQEACAEAVVSRWQKLDLIVALLVAATASGSAVAGWALWSEPGWRTIWATGAGTAALGAIIDNAMTVPSRIKEQEELRRVFSGLRVSLETFREELKIGLDADNARQRYTKILERYEQVVTGARRDLALTKGLSIRVQREVNDKLKQGGLI